MVLHLFHLGLEEKRATGACHSKGLDSEFGHTLVLTLSALLSLNQ